MLSLAGKGVTQPVRDDVMYSRILYFSGIICVFFLLLSGCGSNDPQPGVVARVNEEPIYLSQLESEHDLVYMDWSSANDFDVTSLKTEYGEVLGNLILQALICQTLTREGLAVTDAEVVEAESVIRSDYPDREAFEQTLIDSYVDIEEWRKCLRARLSTKKFLHEYLRPTVTITYETAREYYRKHIADFIVPERFFFAVIGAKDRETLLAGVAVYRKQGDGPAEHSPDVEIHDMDVPLNALSPVWRSILSGLKPGQASAVQTGKNGVTVLYLKKRIPETILSPSQAYPLVENVLTENKLKSVFAGWIRDASAAARIEITPFLKIGAENDAVSPAGDTNAT